MPCLATALALALSAQQPQYDTVLLANGGVVRGTIIENVPEQDLVLQMPDGTIRKVPRAEVAVVYYAGMQPPEAPPEAPPPPPPEAPTGLEGGVHRWQFAIAIAGDFPLGNLGAGGLTLAEAVTPQLVLEFEAAYRFIAPLAVGAYFRLGGGSSQPALNGFCTANGGWCDSLDMGLGLFARWSFLPTREVNPWVSLGGGFEWLDVSNDGNWVSFAYTGWEVVASVGVDWRLGNSLGMGLYLQGRLAEFEAVDVTGAPTIWGGPTLHGWIEVGYRFVFGP